MAHSENLFIDLAEIDEAAYTLAEQYAHVIGRDPSRSVREATAVFDYITGDEFSIFSGPFPEAAHLVHGGLTRWFINHNKPTTTELGYANVEFSAPIRTAEGLVILEDEHVPISYDLLLSPKGLEDYAAGHEGVRPANALDRLNTLHIIETMRDSLGSR